MNLLQNIDFDLDKVIAVDEDSIAFCHEVKLFIEDFLAKKNATFDIKTSGSTGTPKTITHCKEAALHSALQTFNALHISENSSTFLCLPIDKIGGKMVVIRALLFNQTIYVQQPKSNPLLLVNFPKHIAIASFTPTQLSFTLTNETSLAALQKIENILIGGSGISELLKTTLQQKLPHTNCYETFGMTETISHIALKNISKNEDHFSLLPNITIATDKESKLIISCPTITPNKIYTNDIIELKNENEFSFKGRWDNVINSGGLKFYPEELEQKIRPYISNSFYFTAKKDEIFGEKIVLIIEGEFDREAINKILSQQLSNIEKPKEIIHFPKFSYTENGKLIRKSLDLK